MSEELKACPFCGGTDIGSSYIETYSTDSSYDVFGCRSCGARFEDGSEKDWNTRTTLKAGHGEPVAWMYVEKTPEGFEYKPDFSVKRWVLPHDDYEETVLYTAPPATADAVSVPRELLESLLERYDSHALVRSTMSRVEELRALLARQEVKL